MTVVTVADAQAQLPELIDKLSTGEEVVIVRDNLAVAQLVPVKPARPRPRFGSCKGMLTIISDDDEHLDHFAEYVP